jgi:hypothetical protein
MTTSVRQVFGHGAGSLERTRSRMGVARPASIRQMAGAFVQDIVFDEPIVTDEALGGQHRLTLHRDGSYRYQGHMRATGFPSFEVSVLATLGYPIDVPPDTPTAAAQVAFAAHGECHGTNEPGDREFSWDQQGALPILAAEWEGLRRCTLQRRVDFDTDFFGVAGDAVSFVAQTVLLASAFGAVGVAVILAGEAAQIDQGQMVVPGTVGIVVGAAGAFVFGPSMLIPAFIAGAAVAAAAIKQRPMTGPERDFADQVFRGRVPYDRVLLTNLTGLGGRPFTCPGPGGVIIVNLGDGFDHPTTYVGKGGSEDPPQRAPGQLLIHELTHAWQIANETFLPEYYCRALGTSVGTAGGNMSAYDYGPAGPPWQEFGTEMQAAIVDGWFAGNMAPQIPGKNQPQGGFPAQSEADVTQGGNPYFRYVRDNIRSGVA